MLSPHAILGDDDAEWSVAFLAEALGEGLHVVLESPRAKDSAFLHYQDEGDARDERPYYSARTRELKLTFAQYLDRAKAARADEAHPVYLQTLLCAPGKTRERAPSRRLPEMTFRTMSAALARRIVGAGDALDRLSQSARLGPLNVSNLFVSDRGAKSPLHFDEYDNVTRHAGAPPDHTRKFHTTVREREWGGAQKREYAGFRAAQRPQAHHRRTTQPRGRCDPRRRAQLFCFSSRG